jgi:hypothetical protein
VDEIVLAEGDPGDDTVAMATLLRPDVKIVTHKSDSKGDVLPTGFRTCPREIIVMPDADGPLTALRLWFRYEGSHA